MSSAFFCQGISADRTKEDVNESALALLDGTSFCVNDILMVLLSVGEVSHSDVYAPHAFL